MNDQRLVDAYSSACTIGQHWTGADIDRFEGLVAEYSRCPWPARMLSRPVFVQPKARPYRRTIDYRE